MRAFLRTVKTVLWGFLGIRRRRDYDADIAGNKPGHVIATGLLMAAVLVALLVAAARWAVRAAL